MLKARKVAEKIAHVGWTHTILAMVMPLGSFRNIRAANSMLQAGISHL